MASVWKQPRLTGLEVTWRWLTASLLLCFLYVRLGASVGEILHRDAAGLSQIASLDPAAAIQILAMAMVALLRVAEHGLRWWIPFLFVAWNSAAAAGRRVVLKRLDSDSRVSYRRLFGFGMLRASLLIGVWLCWCWVVTWSVRTNVVLPASRGSDPSFVLLSAIVIFTTLFFYVAWAALSWSLMLAPLTSGGARDLAKSELRSNLIQTNLVMCIVRLALFVLAMVLSASPLPFSNVETEAFLACWWIGVVLLYLAALDYFHVVRVVAYLTVWRTYAFREEAISKAV